MDSSQRYRELDREQIMSTIERLRNRINERFPASGLGRVAAELIRIAHETSSLSEYFAKPNWAIRSATVFGVILMLATVIFVATSIRLDLNVSGIADFFQGAEAAVSMLVFLGASVFFLASLETRLKRSKALPALHQLRSVAHIVDMHQLTKDPEHLAIPAASTASSPERSMTPIELGRYLDYCSELLSLVSKLAALHVQYLNDAVVLNAVNDIEQLSNQLSNKIWQKITLLEKVVERNG
jgi:hypothetical protein